jgi:hypothetical protein
VDDTLAHRKHGIGKGSGGGVPAVAPATFLFGSRLRESEVGVAGMRRI